MSTFGFNHLRLRGLRQSLLLKQEQVADLVGVTKDQYSRWELGKVVPRSGKVEALARALNCDPSEFFKWDSPANEIADIVKRHTGREVGGQRFDRGVVVSPETEQLLNGNTKPLARSASLPPQKASHIREAKARMMAARDRLIETQGKMLEMPELAELAKQLWLMQKDLLAAVDELDNVMNEGR